MEGGVNRAREKKGNIEFKKKKIWAKGFKINCIQYLTGFKMFSFLFHHHVFHASILGC